MEKQPKEAPPLSLILLIIFLISSPFTPYLFVNRQSTFTQQTARPITTNLLKSLRQTPHDCVKSWTHSRSKYISLSLTLANSKSQWQLDILASARLRSSRLLSHKPIVRNMDNYNLARAPGANPTYQYQQSHYSTSTSRPWHNPAYKAQPGSFNRQSQQAQHTKGDYYGNFSEAGIDIYALVDSWRSYKDDTTNLQSAVTPSSNLNASAPSFQPAQTGSYYRPYEPLRSVHHYARYPTYRVNKPYRTSDGARERQLIEQAKKGQKSTDTQPGLIRRCPVKANKAQADQPLPSIEPSNLDYFLRSNSLNKAPDGLQKEKYKRPAARSKTPRETASPAPPSTTQQYTSQAQKEPVRVDKPRKLLVILDLNGTLLYRVKSGTTKIYMRPGVTPLLDYLFTNHVVMVYTSTMPSTAQDMVNQFIHPAQRNKLAAIWARDKLDLNKDQYRSKVQVYKKLDKVWKDATIQAAAGPGNRWDQSNTILIDDSKLKALAQPHNLLQVLEYTREDDPAKETDKAASKKKHKMQVDILKQLQLKLEELRYQQDVSRLIRKWQSSEMPVPTAPGQVVSVEEDVDQKKVQQQQAADESEQAEIGRPQLPTPVSLVDGDSAERPMKISDDEDDGGLILSFSSSPVSEPPPAKSSKSVQIPGLTLLEGVERKNAGPRQSSESSIDEDVFKDLLEADRK